MAVLNPKNINTTFFWLEKPVGFPNQNGVFWSTFSKAFTVSLLFKLRSALQRLQAGSLVLTVRRLPGVGEMGDGELWTQKFRDWLGDICFFYMVKVKPKKRNGITKQKNVCKTRLTDDFFRVARLYPWLVATSKYLFTIQLGKFLSCSNIGGRIARQRFPKNI